jgi:DNA-binding XRE family transcriptional regulator
VANIILNVYGELSPEIQRIPPRSILLCIEPIGIGTAAVESLSSYISRVAAAHCITTGTLFSKVLFPYLNKKYMNHIIAHGGNGFYDSAHIINGFSNAAEEFINMMCDLTGNSLLAHLTLSRYKYILTNRGLLRRNKVWCPACLQEMKDNKIEIYEPLIWMINAVNVCLIHQLKLRNQCNYCFKASMVMNRKSRSGYCTNCSSWLGQNNLSIQQIEDWELAKVIMAEEILSSNKQFRNSGIPYSLKKLVCIFANSNITEFAKKIGVPKTTFWGWYNSKNIPSLEDVMRICNKFGIGIFDFYSNQFHFEKPTVTLAKRKRKINKVLTITPLIDVGKNAKKIVLDQSTAAINVISLAKRLHCNKKTLYKYFGDLCKTQSIKNKKYIRQKQIERIQMINKQVESTFKTLIDSGNLPTTRRIEEKIIRPAIFKEVSIRENFLMLRKNMEI